MTYVYHVHYIYKLSQLIVKLTNIYISRRYETDSVHIKREEML